MQILDALGLYQVQLDADGRSVHTRRQYERHVRLLAQWLVAGGRPSVVGEITHQALAAFLVSPDARDRPDGRPKKATAANALRSSLRTFFAYAHAAGLTPTNPARLIRRARCAPAPPRGLTVPEQTRLLGVLAQAEGEAGERDRVLFSLLLAAGLRIGSALAIDIEDVDTAGGQLYLRTMKGGGGQTIYFNERLAGLLDGLIGDQAEGPLFTSRHRRRLSVRQVARRLEYWLRRAGCRRASPHALRHSFGQGIYDRTGDPFLVQAAMGHRSMASTLTYATVGSRDVRAAVVSEDWGAKGADRGTIANRAVPLAGPA